jgi:hypothetical protein
MTQRRTRQPLQRVWLLAALAAGSGVAAAAPPPLPEDLLEYLGSWETDDADWLVANAAAAVAAAQPVATTTTTPKTTTAAPRVAPAAPVVGAERKP